MRVLVRFASKTDVVENVSVDDKCLPIVAGIHPYASSSRDTSPLAREAPLWFKTLALEAIYIDCSRRLIYWTPFVSDVSTEDVQMRRTLSDMSDTSGFVPATAKPLYKDSSIYDFDASLKEMMGKCCEVARKFSRKSLSVEEFHKVVAKILHVYILPSVTFTSQDMACLQRALSLVELRLSKAEDDIKNKANTIENLRKSLSKLKSNLLIRENLESETYLRGCKKDFLVAFLKVTESDVDALNIELAAVQRRINWVKDHPDEADCLGQFKERRDNIFLNIEKQIRVREAIKNVISRRELTKRKIKKSEIVNSCFHNIFVEIIRRLEIEDQSLCHLGNDKVSICAAREAVMCTISEVRNCDRSSDRATKFDPVSFLDYQFGVENHMERSSVWLTFQERVAKVLRDKFSLASKCHLDGCQRLTSKICLILSDFRLTKGENHTVYEFDESVVEEDTSCQFSLSLNDVTLRKPTFCAEKSKRRGAVLVNGGCESWSMYVIQPKENAQKVQILDVTESFSDLETSGSFRTLRGRPFSDTGRGEMMGTCNRGEVTPELQRQAVENVTAEVGHVDSVATNKTECPLKRQRHGMKEQVALGTFMCDVDRLKDQIQAHFLEVIDCLDQELQEEDNDEALSHEMRELLWRSYERFFCQKLYVQLMELYTTGLDPGIRKAYIVLSRIPLSEILKGDKLLDLFFGQKAVRGGAVPIPVPARRQTREQISMAKTLSDLSVDVRRCNINDLYSLANADSNDIRRHFQLDSLDIEDGAKASGSDSSQSTSLSNEKSACDSVNSDSLSSSLQSEVSGGSVEEDILDDSEKWRLLSVPEKVEEILSPVLSPFKKVVKKCLDAGCFLDKVRYITKAIESLNKDISQLIGPDFQSACDDIISMLVLALCNLSEEMFVALYVNLRLLVDVRPSFLSGTLWDYNLVSLLASYNYLFSQSICDHVRKQHPESFQTM